MDDLDLFHLLAGNDVTSYFRSAEVRLLYYTTYSNDQNASVGFNSAGSLSVRLSTIYFRKCLCVCLSVTAIAICGHTAARILTKFRMEYLCNTNLLLTGLRTQEGT